MSDQFSRRDWMKTLAAAAALGPARPAQSAEPIQPLARTAGEITDLMSTSDVFIPPRGRSFMKFRFDFPEPAVAFGGHRFSFLIFTEENAYSLDRVTMTATGDETRLTLTATGFTWAGGQQKAPGKLTAMCKRRRRPSNGTSRSRWIARSRPSPRSSATYRAGRCR